MGEEKAERSEVEPGVPEAFVQHFGEVPPVQSYAEHLPPTEYGENTEAGDLFVRADSALKDYQRLREERERDARDRGQDDLYNIAGALHLVHGLMHATQMRSSPGTDLWQTLSRLKERVSAARVEVLGLVGEGK